MISKFSKPDNAPTVKKLGHKLSLFLKFRGFKALDNRGLTLIELLIAMLITAIVIGMVAMFISVGSRNYSHASREIKLQMQAQAITNQLDDIIIESYWVEAKILSINVTAYVVYASSIINVIFFDWDTDMIYIKDYSSISDIAGITAASYTKEENLMSAHVTEFSLVPDQSNNEVLCNIKFENKNANYSTVHTVALRNIMRRP